MNIVSVINTAEAGGAPALLLNWAKDEKRNIHTLIVLQTRGHFSDDYEAIFDSVHYLNLRKNPMELIRGLNQIKQIIRSQSADIVHTHLLQSDLFGIFIAVSGSKVISTVHSASYKAEKNTLSKIIQKIVAQFSFLFDCVIATSDATETFIKQIPYKCKNIVKIKNCTITSLDMENKIANKNFLCLSRWHPVKDHETLLAGFAAHCDQFNDSTLTLSGDGISDSNTELVAMLEKYNIQQNVIILNDNLKLQRDYTNYDVLVLASKSESLSMVGLEAQALGLLIICTRVGEYFEFNSEPNLTFTPGNVEELTECLNFFKSMSSNLILKLRIEGQNRHSSKFTADIWVTEHLKIYEKLL